MREFFFAAVTVGAFCCIHNYGAFVQSLLGLFAVVINEEFAAVIIRAFCCSFQLCFLLQS